MSLHQGVERLADVVRSSVPASMKNIFKILDHSSSHSFDADILVGSHVCDHGLTHHS